MSVWLASKRMLDCYYSALLRVQIVCVKRPSQYQVLCVVNIHESNDLTNFSNGFQLIWAKAINVDSRMIPMLKGSLNTEKGSIWTRHSEKCNTSWLKSEKGSIWTPHSEKCNTSWLKSEKGSIWTPQSHFSNTLTLKKAKRRNSLLRKVAHEHHL